MLAAISTDGGWKKVTSFLEGIEFHRRNLSRLPAKGILVYLGTRFHYRGIRLRNWAAEHLCLALGRRAPSALRHLRVAAVNGRASRMYTPRIYRGKVTYFQASADRHLDPEPFWRDVARDGLEIHIVPGNDIHVLGEPNVLALAEKLRQAMEQAVGGDAPAARHLESARL